MMKKQSEISMLSAKFRAGTITAQEELHLQELEAAEPKQPTTKVNSIFDLPITAKLWVADARSVEK